MLDSFEEASDMSFGLKPFLQSIIIWNFKDFNAKAGQYYFVLLDPYAY